MSQSKQSPLVPELVCSNFEDSFSFFTDILGFNVQYRSQGGGFAMLERQGAFVMLEQLAAEDPEVWLVAPLEVPFGRGINLRIETDDVDLLYARVLSSGADIFRPLEDKWYRGEDVERGNRQFIVQDPDGYLLRFYQSLGERRRF